MAGVGDDREQRGWWVRDEVTVGQNTKGSAPREHRGLGASSRSQALSQGWGRKRRSSKSLFAFLAQTQGCFIIIISYQHLKVGRFHIEVQISCFS